jgi:hypothetical protein
MQSKYANPVVPPPPPPSVVYYNAGGLGTNQAIIAWSTDGAIWNASDNGNTIFNGAVRSIKYGEGTGLNFWVAVGNGINVVARSFDGKAWFASIPSNPLQNLNNILTAGYGVVPVLNPDVGVAIRWIVVGQGSPNTIAYSNNNAVVWSIASSTDPSLNNPFGINGVGSAVASNNIDKVIAVGLGQHPNLSNINMVQSSDGGLSWSVVNSSPFNVFQTPKTIIYGNSRWLAGGDASNLILESPIYFSDNNGVNWQNASSSISGGLFSAGGVCIDIAYRGSSPNDGKANYVAVGQNLFGISGRNQVYSFNGSQWFSVSNTTIGIMRSVTYYAGVSGGTWVIVGDPLSGPYSGSFYSTDGITWFPSPNFNGLFQNGSLSVGSVSGI